MFNCLVNDKKYFIFKIPQLQVKQHFSNISETEYNFIYIYYIYIYKTEFNFV